MKRERTIVPPLAADVSGDYFTSTRGSQRLLLYCISVPACRPWDRSRGQRASPSGPTVGLARRNVVPSVSSASAVLAAEVVRHSSHHWSTTAGSLTHVPVRRPTFGAGSRSSAGGWPPRRFTASRNARSDGGGHSVGMNELRRERAVDTAQADSPLKAGEAGDSIDRPAACLPHRSRVSPGRSSRSQSDPRRFGIATPPSCRSTFASIPVVIQLVHPAG